MPSQNRWEFYVQLFLFQLSQTFVNVAFRVLFSELIPPGSEVEWFGLQIILSCGTVSGHSFDSQGPSGNILGLSWNTRSAFGKTLNVRKTVWLTLEIHFAQVWINYVASGPLQNATHQLRFPLVISLIFLILPVVLEVCRGSFKTFEVDRKRWQRADNTASTKSTPSTSVDYAATVQTDTSDKA